MTNSSATYRVSSNPITIDDSDLIVLFSGESQTAPMHKLGPKVYDFYLVHHIISGSGVFELEGVSYPLGPGDNFMIEPNRLVSYQSDQANPWRYRWAAFRGERAAPMLAAAGISSEHAVIHTGKRKDVPILMHKMERAFRSGKPIAHLEALGYLHLLISRYAEAVRQQTEPWDERSEVKRTVKQMLHYMSSQYAQPITIEQMAEHLGYNRAYLSRIFKRYTDQSPASYLLKLRIDKARLLLRERLDLTVEQIASSVGFQDALYFSRQFKRFYGMPPTAYRQLVSRPESEAD